MSAARMLSLGRSAIGKVYAVPARACISAATVPWSRRGEGLAYFSAYQEARSTEPLPEEPAAQADAPADAQEARIAELSAELSKSKAQTAELANSRVRLLAEMENVRTIARRDVDIAKNFAVQSFAKRLLDVVDNLHRAVESIPQEARVKRGDGDARADAFALLYEGVSATERDFLKTLGQFGIEQFGKPGDAFDYNRYEAIAQLPATDGQQPNTVVQVLKTGYSLKERTLRPAQVVVAVAPPA